jgi:hypothetical protein
MFSAPGLLKISESCFGLVFDNIEKVSCILFKEGVSFIKVFIPSLVIPETSTLLFCEGAFPGVERAGDPMVWDCGTP